MNKYIFHILKVIQFTSQKKRTLFYLVLIIIISSCSTHVNNSLIDKYTKTKPELKKINYENKQIYFLSIIHIGTKEYYNEITNKIDSLQSKGYKILYEGNELVRYSTPIPNDKIQYYLKFRKITGFDILLPYSKIYPYSEYSKKYNLIDQPNYADFNMSSKNSESADLTIESLIKEYENNYNQIHLDSCDYKTPLKSKYSCSLVNKDERNIFSKEIILNKRNEFLTKKIKNEKSDSLLIIYGKNHFEDVKKILENN